MKKKVVPPHKKNIPGGAGPKGRVEKDIDDLVHSPDHEMSSDENEDPDDLVHRKGQKKMDDESMEDPDDLVHDNTDEDENDR